MARNRVPKVHRLSGEISKASLCGGIRKANALSLMTENNDDVTCKMCIKSMRSLWGWGEDHGECQCCGVRLTGAPECQSCFGTP